MKVLLSWLNEFLQEKPSASEVASGLTSIGIEVGDVVNLAQGFDQVVVARIEEKQQHPNADRLSLCRVTDGTSHYNIVCGANNMKEGDYVALARVGAHLPNGLKIKKSKIRGESSEGMLCSEAELKIAEDSEGIVILSEDTLLGKDVASVMGRDDWLLELELTPNRGDCLSVIGVAREISVALKIPTKIPMRDGEGPSDLFSFLASYFSRLFLLT